MISDPVWRHLDFLKNSFLFSALAPTTINTYSSGVRQYLSFCLHFRIPPLPLRESVLENFCSSLHPRVAYKSMKVYLSGVQCWSKMQLHDVEIASMGRLRYVLRGIRRVQGLTHAKPPRTPITWDLLCTIISYVFHTEVPHNRDMLSSAVLLAFFGMLRVSEFTSPSRSTFDVSTHLTFNDVHIDLSRRIAFINIKVSKTDPFRNGVVIRIGMLNHLLCPVLALCRYLSHRGSFTGPLFVFHDGSFLTRTHICELLKRSLPFVPHVNSHSFRRGGATALAAAGTHSHVIQILGRWSSDAYKKYIELSDNFITQTFAFISHR